MTFAPSYITRGPIRTGCLLLVLLLVVVLASPSPGFANQAPAPSTPAAPSRPQAGLLPSADSYVLQSQPNGNFGHDRTMVADLDPRSEAYLRFDVTGATGPVSRAVLRLWVTNASTDAPALWVSSNITWEETGVTWNTRPAADAEISNQAATASDSWLEYDVTSAVTGNGAYTFALIAEHTDGTDVASRESQTNQPVLVIEPSETQSIAPIENSEHVLLAAGDISRCDSDDDELTARILDQQEGTIAALGDLAYDSGSPEEFANCYDPTWGRYKGRTRPVPGNHEYFTEAASGYFDYFGAAAGEPEKGYYSYDIGTWHIIALNSNIDMSKDSRQMAWLLSDLEQHPVECTLAYWHHPRFSSGEEHGNNSDVIPLYRALYEQGVDVVLNGHEHNYERFAPQAADGTADSNYGVREFVVGTGGAYLRNLGERKPNSEVWSNAAHGVLQLVLEDGTYSWTFLPAEGEAFADSGTDSCHGAPSGDVDVGTPVGWLRFDRQPARTTVGYRSRYRSGRV